MVFKMNTTVLLMTYGSPERIDDLDEYLRNIFGNKPVPESAFRENMAKYEKFGGRSPSNDIIKKISRKLEKSLSSYGDFSVFVTNKHWHPGVEERISEIKGSFDRIVALPLFALNSQSIRSSYYDPLASALNKFGVNAKMEFVNGLNNYDLFIPMWLSLASEMALGDSLFLFDAHSLPPGLNEDSYVFSLRYNAYRISQMLNLKSYDYGFQGISGDRWLRPSIVDVVKKYENDTVSVIPISFLYDHLEILYDLDFEFASYLEANGKKYRRCQMPNDNPMMISLLRRAVLDSAVHMNGESIKEYPEKS